MTNPFDAPATGNSSTPGVVDVGRCFSDGWEALQRNMIMGSAGIFLALVAYMLSVALCLVPVLVVGPALAWGMVRFSQQMLDGEADLATLFSGFNNIGDYWASVMGGILALVAGYFVLELPLFILQGIVGYTESTMLALLMIPVSLGYAVLMVYLGARINFWIWFVVDQRLGAMDAITKSWEMTAQSALPLVFLTLGLSVVAFIGMLFCGVGLFPAAALGAAAQASAYRQLIGR